MTFPTMEQVAAQVALETGNPNVLQGMDHYYWDQAVDYLTTQHSLEPYMERGLMPRMETPEDFLRHAMTVMALVNACIEKVIKPSEQILLDALKAVMPSKACPKTPEDQPQVKIMTIDELAAEAAQIQANAYWRAASSRIAGNAWQDADEAYHSACMAMSDAAYKAAGLRREADDRAREACQEAENIAEANEMARGRDGVDGLSRATSPEHQHVFLFTGKGYGQGKEFEGKCACGKTQWTDGYGHVL